MQPSEPCCDVLGLPQREPAAARGDDQPFHVTRSRTERPLPPAHRKLLVHAVEQHQPVRLVLLAGRALEAADRGARHQAVAVDAHEARGELALERDQRLLDQVLALARAHRDVLLLGAQEKDVAHRTSAMR